MWVGPGRRRAIRIGTSWHRRGGRIRLLAGVGLRVGVGGGVDLVVVRILAGGTLSRGGREKGIGKG